MWFAIARDTYGRPIYDEREIEDVEYEEITDAKDEND